MKHFKWLVLRWTINGRWTLSNFDRGEADVGPFDSPKEASESLEGYLSSFRLTEYKTSGVRSTYSIARVEWPSNPKGFSPVEDTPKEPIRLVSEYENELVISSSYYGSGDKVLTVELGKWYQLYLVSFPCNGTYEVVSFGVLQETSDETGIYPPFVDHVPNPKVVEAYCAKQGYILDELAYELLVGRWIVDVKDEVGF